MKWNNLFSLASVIFIFSSCGKESPLHATFHGRVTYSCDGSPVKGMEVYIVRNSYLDRYIVGYATTDENGYYQLQTKVKREGVLDYYELVTTSKISPKPDYFIIAGFTKNYSTDDDNKSVTIDISIPAYQVVKFHIKNTNPFDDNDVFILSNVQYDYSSQGPLQLFGMQVDTMVRGYGTQSEPFPYTYQFIKNGIDSLVSNSIIPVGCFNEPVIDIFY